jgi:MFS superfamily sulfate permease-like transporter
MKSSSLFRYWKQDLPASVVVFLVALPLCLGIALASGAPLIAGVVAGVVGGVIVGLASGSPMGVSGPAAGLTAIVLTAITQLGSYEIFLTAVVLAGVLQLAMGLLRAGIIAYYFPSSVIKGMLAGIGVIIVLKQIPHAVGYDADFFGDLAFEQPDQQNTFSELVHMLNYISPGAVVVTLVSMFLMILWERPFIQKNKVLKFVPGPLLAVIAGIVLANVFTGVPQLIIGAGHYVDLPSITGFDVLPRPDLSGLMLPMVWTTAFTIAIVASLETLLCVEATDKMDPWRRTTPANRELYAQGAGNMISGLLGGLPVTQVIVRSSANIQAGGRYKLSSILHGMLLLVSVLSIPFLLRQIPLASLAAILLLVGYKLSKPSLYKIMWKAGFMQFVPFVVTVLGVAFTDLLTGVGMGMAVAIVHILYKNYRVPFHFDPNKHLEGMPIHIELSEDVTFLNKAGIRRTLNELPRGSRVVVDARRTIDLDPDVMEIIQEAVESGKEHNIQYELVGFRDKPKRSVVDLHRQVEKAAQDMVRPTVD